MSGSNEVEILRQQVATLIDVVSVLNLNVKSLNRATFGEAEPQPGDDLGAFGFAIGQKSVLINNLLDDLKRVIEAQSTQHG